MRRLPGNSVLLAVLLVLSAGALAQSPSNGNLSNPVQVQVVKLTIEDFSFTHLVIAVQVAARCKCNVAVNQVVFSGLALNGIPVDAAPFKHRFKLSSHESVLPQPFMVTVNLRDLDSVKPLHDAIANGYATLDGVAMVQVPLNLLERVMLLSGHAEVATKLHQEVPVNIPGGHVVAASLLKFLDLTDEALKGLDSGISGATKLVGK